MNSIGEDLAYVSLENEGSLHARKGGICCPPWQLTMIHKYTSDPIHLAMTTLTYNVAQQQHDIKQSTI
eukprot:scaffold169224_cov19-Tisochrysis_lutea.AAC.1